MDKGRGKEEIKRKDKRKKGNKRKKKEKRKVRCIIGISIFYPYSHTRLRAAPAVAAEGHRRASLEHIRCVEVRS
jgi:hypothetical protein